MRRMFSLEQLKAIADSRVQAVASSGDLENVKIFEEIVDKDGHKRFIDIDFSAKPIEHITYTYTKASLSGSHLLIVLAGQVETGTGDIVPQTMADVSLPEWIVNKIFPTYGAYVGSFTGQIITAETYATFGLNFPMDKSSNGVRIDLGENIALGENIRYFRVSIDLLIDNE